MYSRGVSRSRSLGLRIILHVRPGHEQSEAAGKSLKNGIESSFGWPSRLLAEQRIQMAVDQTASSCHGCRRGSCN